MLLKNNFNKSGFKILGDWASYDLLKGPGLRRSAFVGGLMGSGMLAATSSSAIDNPYLGQAAQTL